MSKPLQVLILEDQPADAELVIFELEQAGFEFEWQRVYSETDYLAHLHPELDLILSDYTMPQFNAVRALTLLQQHNFDIPFIVVTGTMTEEVAVDCMRRGADDYLLKDRLTRLSETVKQSLRQKALRDEKIQAQRHLQESVQRFLALFEFSPIGMAMIDAKGQFLQANSAFQQIFSYEEADLPSLSFSQLIHEEDQARYMSDCQNLLGNNLDYFKYEMRYYHKKGHIVWGETTMFLLKEHKPTDCIITIVQDVTERKQTEILLSNQARQQRAVADLGQEALLGNGMVQIMDQAVKVVVETLDVTYCKILELQPDARTLLLKAGIGWPENAIGQASIDLEANSPAAYTLQAHEPVIIDNLRTENRFNGSGATLSNQDAISEVSVLIPGKERPFGVLGIETTRPHTFTQDEVSFLEAVANILATAIERQLAEDALRENEARYRAIVEDQTEFICRWRPDRTLIFVNEAYCRCHAKEAVELIDQDFLPHIFEADRVEIARQLAALGRENPIVVTEHRVVAPNGEISWQHWTNRAIFSDNGNLSEVQSVGRDVTNRRLAEEALRQSETRYKTLFEKAPAAIFTKDRDGFYTSVNQNTLTYWSRNPVGFSDAELLPPEVAVPLREADLQVMKTGQELVFEEYMSTPNGSRIVLSHKVPLRDADQEIVGILGISLEITERKRMEEALRESERRYQTLAALSPVGIFRTDAQGDRIFYANERLQQKFGPGPLEILAQRWIDAIHVDDRDQVLQMMAKAVAKQSVFQIEYRLHQASGQQIWVLVRGVPEEDANGEIVGYIGTVTDITERKLAEEQMVTLYNAERKRYAEAEALREAALALVSTVDLDQVIERILAELQNVVPFDSASVQLRENDRLKIIGGRGFENLEEVLGYTFMVRPETPNARVFDSQEPVIIDDVLQTEYAYAFRHKPHDGHPSIRNWLGVPLRIGEEIIGMLTIDRHQPNFYNEAHAKTAQAYAAQAAIAIENARLLAEMERRVDQLALLHELDHAISVSQRIEDVYQAFVGHTSRIMPYHYMSIALLKEDYVQFDFINGVGQAMVGSEQPLSGSALGWVIAQGQPLVRHNIGVDMRFIEDKEWDEGGIQSIMIIPLKVKREVIGTWNIGHRQISAYDPDNLAMAQAMGDQLAIAIENNRLREQAQQEITERKQAQEALEIERSSLAHRVSERTAELSRANAELARASRLKDEFLASMSHELRTPLNAILGMGEVLTEEVYGPLTEKQAKSVRTIEQSGKHLLSLINDILDLSKIGAGKLQLEIGQVSVERLCQASLQFIRQTALKKQIKISSHYDKNFDSLQADERRLKQILVNLLSNAVKFTPEGGQIKLAVIGDETNGVIHFVVEDSGIGIPKEYMEHLFQPFVQLDSRLSRQYAGTGLGLSLVYRLTEMHGGSVTVESEVDQGSHFTVSLPLQSNQLIVIDPEPMIAETESKQKNVSSGSPPLILLVEDNQANVDMMSEYLTSIGYQIVIAYNGLQGLERAKETHPDLILMDIQMPELDGLETLKQIRAHQDIIAAIPIIAVTALAMPGDRERCLAAGANEYLSKPLSLKNLAQLIEQHLKV